MILNFVAALDFPYLVMNNYKLNFYLFSNFSSSLFIATPACPSLVRRAGRHQDSKFHESKALTLCYSLCPLSLCGYFSPPHEKLLLPFTYTPFP
jgi:hypothetical protein